MSLFHRFTRRAPVAAVVAALALFNLTAPASAATYAGGEVTGTVAVSPGTPLDATTPCGPTTYTFSSTNITGVFATVSGASATTATGSVAVTASGGSACESSATASGSVTINSCAGGGTVLASTTASDIGKPAALTCAGSGVFVRVGAAVAVQLTLTICVTTPSGTTCATARVVVAAAFVPTLAGLGCKDANGVPHCVTQATFAGVFAGEDVV